MVVEPSFVMAECEHAERRVLLTFEGADEFRVSRVLLIDGFRGLEPCSALTLNTRRLHVTDPITLKGDSSQLTLLLLLLASYY